jgi:hypothetical protein
MSKRKMLVIVVLVLVAVAILAGPVSALSRVWEHRWDAKSIWIDRPRTSNAFHSYGWDYHKDIYADIQWTRYVNCQGAGYGERVYVQANTSGITMVQGGCLQMTPTPAPTMAP